MPNISTASTSFAVQTRWRFLVVAAAATVVQCASVILDDLVGLPFPPWSLSALAALLAYAYVRNREVTEYGDSTIRYRGLVRTRCIDVVDIEYLARFGGAGLMGRVVVAKVRDRTIVVRIGPDGGSVTPAEAGPFVDALSRWAEAHDLPITAPSGFD